MATLSALAAPKPTTVPPPAPRAPHIPPRPSGIPTLRLQDAPSTQTVPLSATRTSAPTTIPQTTKPSTTTSSATARPSSQPAAQPAASKFSIFSRALGSQAASTTTKPSTPSVPTPDPTTVLFAPILEKMKKLKSSMELRATWRKHTTSGSLFNKKPAPVTIHFPLTRIMMQELFDFSVPLAPTVREGVVVYWHFHATGGSLPPATLSLSVSSTSASLGWISPTTEKIDITQTFRSHISSFQRLYTSNTEPTVTLSISVNGKAYLQSIQSVLAVHKRLGPLELVAKMYDRVLAKEKEAIKTDVEVWEAFKKRPRDLGALLKGVLKLCRDGTIKPWKDTSSVAGADDIAVGNSIVNFSCPLSLVRIKHPAKGKNCKHRQVFDAENRCRLSSRSTKRKKRGNVLYAHNPSHKAILFLIQICFAFYTSTKKKTSVSSKQTVKTHPLNNLPLPALVQ
ncbi:hypothetical protein BCR33DRAFT_212436 [Rhizoclosmatium globosum]|uniref:SP-RING-type domain-containing protein n=1 Tax=Rhizoclosmatium globosum TaxID=329046 RepID=A0A1Y2CF45_9FUNG|nr:hypothetical protein BCR33DRAFT_212436 [Rhizoclosmatium globosum]|eukprot:ORY44925.1 hypothetical protein BCR33DRAFT_212436 [Rhizoclosmatium globosum]